MMKKLISFALVLVLSATLFVGCGKFDMESADLDSYVKLGAIDTFSYEELAAHHRAYREKLGQSASSFYLTAGYTIDFAVTCEVADDDGIYQPFAGWTFDGEDYIKDYDMYRYSENSVFDQALSYQLENANASTSTARTVTLDEAFSFTLDVPGGHEIGEVSDRTVRFTVTIKKVLPAVYGDSQISDDLSEFYNMYASSKDVIAEGDSVNIDFVGRINGEKFDGGSGEGYMFVVGEGGFVPGFEEQLIGHKNGEVFEITVTFPEDYYEELANKTAIFTITVNDVSSDNAIIAENSPFSDIWELKEHYRLMHYIEFALVDFIADSSEIISLPEALVDDFRDIYSDYVKREITNTLFTYTEQGVECTKAEIREMLYPDGSDKTYIEEMANDAAYNYILVHLLCRELGLEYSDEDFESDVEMLASDYSSYYGETYTAKDIKTLMGEEVLRLSFMDALISETLSSRVTGVPVFGAAAE